jgi:hypothetical protein
VPTRALGTSLGIQDLGPEQIPTYAIVLSAKEVDKEFMDLLSAQPRL